MIHVEGLTKRYGQSLAIDNISFHINKGEVVGLLGPNGAGKTTTMKILTCFISATAGRASINGHDTFDSPLQVKEQIGYLPESCPLYHDMDVGAYLAFSAEVRGIPSGKRKSAVERVISDCDLGKVHNKLIGHLSKGYRQRVGLAQALIHDPAVLILDEPTSGLDPNQIRDILSLINNLGQEKTVIHSTHILSEVETTSDRVLIINNGHIVAQGTPRELMSRSSGTTVYVTLKGADAQVQLSEASFVRKAEKISDARDGFIRLAVQGADQRDVALDVYKMAVEKNWLVSELKAETASLEDVFAKLTRG
ncbi:MAG: ATP-binding cassette domain-containing protein [Fibrobacteria bacterium]